MNISASYNVALQTEINRVSKQITTGNKISQGFEDSNVFKKTIDLDSDIQFNTRLKENAEIAKSFTQYTDSTLNSMTDTLENFKSKILAYGGQVHSKTSREALVNGLQSLKSTMYNLANTKVDGEYIFGGTNTKIQPIDLNGNYQGNDKRLSITTDRSQKTGV